MYVTHDQGEAMVISDRIMLMNQGSIVQQGTARDLYETPRIEFAAKFVGFSNLIPPSSRRRVRLPRLSRCRGSTGWGAAGVWGGAPRALRRRGGHLQFAPSRSGSNGPAMGHDRDAVGVLPANVRDVVYAGNLCDVFLNVGEFKVRAQVHPNQIEGFAPGDDVSAVFDARSVWPVTKDTVSEDAGDEAADDESPVVPEPDVAGGLAPPVM